MFLTGCFTTAIQKIENVYKIFRPAKDILQKQQFFCKTKSPFILVYTIIDTLMFRIIWWCNSTELVAYLTTTPFWHLKKPGMGLAFSSRQSYSKNSTRSRIPERFPIQKKKKLIFVHFCGFDSIKGDKGQWTFGQGIIPL